MMSPISAIIITILFHGKPDARVLAVVLFNEIAPHRSICCDDDLSHDSAQPMSVGIYIDYMIMQYIAGMSCNRKLMQI